MFTLISKAAAQQWLTLNAFPMHDECLWWVFMPDAF